MNTRIYSVNKDKDINRLSHQLKLVAERHFKGMGALKVLVQEDFLNNKLIFRIEKKQNRPHEGTYLNPVRAEGSEESV